VLVALLGRGVQEPGGVDGFLFALEEGLAAAGVALTGPGGQGFAARPQNVKNNQPVYNRAFQHATNGG